MMNDNNKRVHQRSQEPLPASSSPTNKRRKNNNNNKHEKNNNKHAKNNNKHFTKNRNWIENCAESVNRIPKNCGAPLLCIITRAEIGDGDECDTDEEKRKPPSILPSSEGILEVENEMGDHVEAVDFGDIIFPDDNKVKLDQNKEVIDAETDCTTAAAAFATVEHVGVDNGGEKDEKDLSVAVVASAAEIQSPSLEVASTTISTLTPTDHRTSNIARPSKHFLTLYTKEKIPFDIPSTIRGDDVEEKKLFIPVKHHASAIGPTKVRSINQAFHLSFLIYAL